MQVGLCNDHKTVVVVEYLLIILVQSRLRCQLLIIERTRGNANSCLQRGKMWADVRSLY